jgi:hypothetical protein
VSRIYCSSSSSFHDFIGRIHIWPKRTKKESHGIKPGLNGGHPIVLYANSSDQEIGCQTTKEKEAHNAALLNGA